MEPSDSLFGECQVLRIVGKNPTISIKEARITDHSTLLTKAQGKIAINSKNKHILSKVENLFIFQFLT